MEVKEKSVKELKPYDKNAKKHDKTQIANVAKSIEKYGFVQPIVVDGENVIVIGHCRYEAAKKLKLDKVPCVCVDDLTPEEINALRLVDNKSNESEWDMDILKDIIPDLDLSDFDFNWDLESEEEEESKERETALFSEQISVVIDCESEDEAEQIFCKLQEEGIQCRIST